MEKLRATYCTTSEFAKFIDKSPRWVQQMIQDEKLPNPNESGHLPTWKTIKAYIQLLQKAAKSGSGENDNLALYKERYARARAEEKELEVEKIKGSLVLKEDVRMVWTNLSSNFRSRLISLPNIIAVQGEMMTRVELKDITTRLIEKSLNELSKQKKFDESDTRNDTK